MKHKERLELAWTSLLGVSIGDAFGESFFGEESVMLDLIGKRKMPETSWEFTDDTVMSIAVFEQLEKNGHINQDELARSFVKNHHTDPLRGYGSTARRILREIEEGKPWPEASAAVFEGMGSKGNGAAMRATCIGAYFHDDPKLCLENAEKSAQVTHFNLEAICGAMATAKATALATQVGRLQLQLGGNEFIREVAQHLPDCDTKSKILKGLQLSKDAHPETLSKVLGNGTGIMAQDTVPLAIWMAAHHLHSFEESLWQTIQVLGDRDTLCAIVGGITVMSSGKETIPLSWKQNVEDFEMSLFRTQ